MPPPELGRIASNAARTLNSRFASRIPVRTGGAAGSSSRLSARPASTLTTDEGYSNRTSFAVPVNDANPARPMQDYFPPPHEQDNSRPASTISGNNSGSRRNSTASIASQIPQDAFNAHNTNNGHNLPAQNNRPFAGNIPQFPGIGNFLRGNNRPNRAGGNPAVENNYYDNDNNAAGAMPYDPMNPMANNPMMQGEVPQPLNAEQARLTDTLNRDNLRNALHDIFATNPPGINQEAGQKALPLLNPIAHNKLKQILEDQAIDGTGGRRWGELGEDQQNLLKEYLNNSVMPHNDKLMYAQTMHSIQEQMDTLVSSIANSGTNRLLGQMQAMLMFGRKLDNLLSAGVG